MNSIDPFTDSIIQSLAAKLVLASSMSQPQTITAMCSEVKFMHDLISNQGFCMMGAHQIHFDNERFSLRWNMGSGALMDTVEFSYNPGKDLFNLRFRHYAVMPTIIDKETEFLGIYDDMVIQLIEQETGFYLRL